MIKLYFNAFAFHETLCIHSQNFVFSFKSITFPKKRCFFHRPFAFSHQSFASPLNLGFTCKSTEIFTKVLQVRARALKIQFLFICHFSPSPCALKGLYLKRKLKEYFTWQ